MSAGDGQGRPDPAPPELHGSLAQGFPPQPHAFWTLPKILLAAAHGSSGFFGQGVVQGFGFGCFVVRGGAAVTTSRNGFVVVGTAVTTSRNGFVVDACLVVNGEWLPKYGDGCIGSMVVLVKGLVVRIC